MAALGPLDSLAHVDIVDAAWVLFVPRLSNMSTALSTERGTRPRATVASQNLTVAPLEQMTADAHEKSHSMFDIGEKVDASEPSFTVVDTRSCSI